MSFFEMHHLNLSMEFFSQNGSHNSVPEELEVLNDPVPLDDNNQGIPHSHQNGLATDRNDSILDSRAVELNLNGYHRIRENMQVIQRHLPQRADTANENGNAIPMTTIVQLNQTRIQNDNYNGIASAESISTESSNPQNGLHEDTNGNCSGPAFNTRSIPKQSGKTKNYDQVQFVAGIEGASNILTNGADPEPVTNGNDHQPSDPKSDANRMNGNY